jgi:very-short-patch-repair endonuclease
MALRNRQVGGFKFRRQHALGAYIADFCCPDAGLVVEIDGPIHHKSVQRDRLRRDELLRVGFRMIRFSNDEVLNGLRTVVSRIHDALLVSPPAPSSPLHSMERGRG